VAGNPFAALHEGPAHVRPADGGSVRHRGGGLQDSKQARVAGIHERDKVFTPADGNDKGAMGCLRNTHNAFRFAAGSMSGEIVRVVRSPRWVSLYYLECILSGTVCVAGRGSGADLLHTA
jgi:hypothetical protein